MVLSPELRVLGHRSINCRVSLDWRILLDGSPSQVRGCDGVEAGTSRRIVLKPQLSDPRPIVLTLSTIECTYCRLGTRSKHRRTRTTATKGRGRQARRLALPRL